MLVGLFFYPFSESEEMVRFSVYCILPTLSVSFAILRLRCSRGVFWFSGFSFRYFFLSSVNFVLLTYY